jgi:hypothetical protein
MSALITALVAELGIITWRDLHQQKIFPPPSDYAAAAIIFSIFGLVGEWNARVATTLGWGIVLATFLELWDPSSPTNVSGAPGAATGTPGYNPNGGLPYSATATSGQAGLAALNAGRSSTNQTTPAQGIHVQGA